MTREFIVKIQDCPDDITAFEVCEAVRKETDSKCSVSVKEIEGEN